MTTPTEPTELVALAAAVRGESTGVSDDLVDVAGMQGVEALLACAPAASDASPAVARRLKAILAAYEVLSAVRDDELTRVLEHLASGGVSPIVIKGAHLAHTIYASPALRPRGDTDLVIAAEEQTATAALLERAGYARRVHVRGSLILGQCHFQRTDGLGIVHALDVHWRLAVPLVFRDVLPAAALHRSRVPIPGLGPQAWGPAAPHALIVACVHLIAHHRADPILIWLQDIARLARALDDDEVSVFLETAGSSRISAVCAAALDCARRHFDGPALASLAGRARAQSRRGPEPSARLLDAARPIDEVWLDLRASVGWRERATLLREHLLPDAAYMRETTAATGWLPLAYARRALRGARKWIAREVIAAGPRTAGPAAPHGDSAAASPLPRSAKTNR
jgi:Uncharacterised nucleotidyltransferase